MGGDIDIYGTLDIDPDSSELPVISFAPGPLYRYLQRSVYAATAKGLLLDLTIAWCNPEDWEIDEGEREYLEKWRKDKKEWSAEKEAQEVVYHRNNLINKQFEYLTCYLSGERQEMWQSDDESVEVLPAEESGNRIRELEILFRSRDWGRSRFSLLYTGPFVNLERVHLERCESIMAENSEKLYHLELIDCDIEGWPNVRNLTTLVVKGCDYDGEFWLPWSELTSLEHLHVLYLGSLLLHPPPSGSIPKLNTLLVERHINHPRGFRDLAARFNSSRPLEILALNEKSMRAYYLYFRASSFCVKTLKMSSLNLRSRPKELAWDWNDYGEVTWKVSSSDVQGARILLQELDRRGTKVVAMDAQMKKIIALVRGEDEGEDEEEDDSEEGSSDEGDYLDVGFVTPWSIETHGLLY